MPQRVSCRTEVTEVTETREPEKGSQAGRTIRTAQWLPVSGVGGNFPEKGGALGLGVGDSGGRGRCLSENFRPAKVTSRDSVSRNKRSDLVSRMS